ncbi:zinc transporter ZIP2 [Pelobates cultripes]|uniref:Zinc transporter ZIP2 n=1 Tax=Pelobates cultripes TaxID=61616 RepID=A0AAD1S869_PELCU|nr:zinc transporter ZIP2 [Pelobates cultripes]
MDQLLAVKVGCLVALLFITLICGLAPPFASWFLKSSVKESYQLVVCLISSFAAGIFLGACLLHVVADSLTDIASELSYINYPMGELILSLGFFLVLFIERFVLYCCNNHQNPSHDVMPLPEMPSTPTADYQEKQDMSSEINVTVQEEPHNHIHPNIYSHASFRSLILFCSLSIHSVFEGLAIGLQSSYSSALEISIAVLIHKGIIVFSLSLKLLQSLSQRTWLVVYIVVFSLMSPIGITIGIIVTLEKSAIVTMVQAILGGIASGTFVYVTFLEILPQELNTSDKPLLKVLFIVIGFTVMAVIAIWA